MRSVLVVLGKCSVTSLRNSNRCLRVVVVVDAQDTKARRFIYSGELVEAPASSSDPRDEFHIELDRAAGNLQRGIGAWGQGDTSSWRSVPRGADKKVSEWLLERRYGSVRTSLYLQRHYQLPESLRSAKRSPAEFDSGCGGWSGRGLAPGSVGLAYRLLPVSSGSASLAEP